MELRPGQKLHSAVSDAQVVVVRAPSADVALACGGAPLLADGEDGDGAATLDASLGDGPLLGKRYVDEEAGPFEYIVSSAAGGRYGDLWPWGKGSPRYPPTDELERAIPSAERISATGPTGTLVVCDTRGSTAAAMHAASRASCRRIPT